MEIDPENDPNQPSGAAVAYVVVSVMLTVLVIGAVIVGSMFGR